MRNPYRADVNGPICWLGCQVRHLKNARQWITKLTALAVVVRYVVCPGDPRGGVGRGVYGTRGQGALGE